MEDITNRQLIELGESLIKKYSLDYHICILPKIGGHTIARCVRKDKQIHISKLEVGNYSVESWKKILLHEVAHGLCFEKYGNHTHYSRSFRLVCYQIGASPQAVFKSDKEVTEKYLKEKYNWKSYCDCDKHSYMIRKPRVKYRCKYCKTALTWHRMEK